MEHSLASYGTVQYGTRNYQVYCRGWGHYNVFACNISGKFCASLRLIVCLLARGRIFCQYEGPHERGKTCSVGCRAFVVVNENGQDLEMPKQLVEAGDW